MRRILVLAAALAAVTVVAAQASDFNMPGLNGQSIMDVVVNILRTLMDLAVEFIGRVLDEIVRAALNFIHGGGTPAK